MEINELVVGVIILLFIMMLWHHMKAKKCSRRHRHMYQPYEEEENIVYILPPNLPSLNMQDESVGTLNDLTIRGCGNNLHKNSRRELLKSNNAKNTRWATDMDIQIDPKQATVEDVYNGRLSYGNGLVNEATWSSTSLKNKVSSKHIGHGNDILTATDYSPENYM